MTDYLRDAARRLRAARRRLTTAMTSAEQAAYTAHQEGIAETVIARELDVNRTTVRKWLGK